MRKLTRSARIPAHIQDTLDWLIATDDQKTLKSLLSNVVRFLPKNDPEIMDFCSQALCLGKLYAEAAEQALQTIELLPQSADAKFNAAKCLNLSGDPMSAEKWIRQALKNRPEWIDAKIELAVYVSMQGRFEEAVSMLQDLEADPSIGSEHNRDVVRFNQGWHFVRLGQFKKGMQRLGIGRKLSIWGRPNPGFKCARLKPGSGDLNDAKVIVVGEGGFGDEIIGFRFAQILRDRGARPVWVTREPLRSLFARSHLVEKVISPEEALALSPGEADFWAPCMDLPVALDLDLHEIPSQSYLTADEQFIERWKTRIPASPKLKVGIRWKGNALYDQDLMRSVPFPLLENLSQLPGIKLYSLQRDWGSEDRGADSPVIDLAPELESWEDTAAAICQLDLVITSCTSIAHLSAALGKETWLLCPLSCYYIWATPGIRSPWYDSVRVFRQKTIGVWTEPLVEIRTALDARIGSRP